MRQLKQHQKIRYNYFEQIGIFQQKVSIWLLKNPDLISLNLSSCYISESVTVEGEEWVKA